jgi:hypothetical protein
LQVIRRLSDQRLKLAAVDADPAHVVLTELPNLRRGACGARSRSC